MHSRHTASRNRQLRAEMNRYGMSIAPTPWERLFVTTAESPLPARTLAFATVPIPRVKARREIA